MSPETQTAIGYSFDQPQKPVFEHYRPINSDAPTLDSLAELFRSTLRDHIQRIAGFYEQLAYWSGALRRQEKQ
jgi:hypothetical protein